MTVLSAYKQGYSWLYDVVRPALAGKPVDQITIRFAEIGPPSGWKQQGMFAPTRWLLEIYPIDEILAAELKIDIKKIRFEMMPIGSPTYEVIATGTRRRRAAAADLRAGDRRAAVLRSLPRLRARARHDRLDQGRRRRPHRGRRAHRDRSRAVLGSLPVEDAAGALRPRDGARQGQAARRKTRRSSAS